VVLLLLPVMDDLALQLGQHLCNRDLRAHVIPLRSFGDQGFAANRQDASPKCAKTVALRPKHARTGANFASLLRPSVRCRGPSSPGTQTTLQSRASEDGISPPGNLFPHHRSYVKLPRTTRKPFCAILSGHRDTLRPLRAATPRQKRKLEKPRGRASLLSA
jgi:hypothetical protein